MKKSVLILFSAIISLFISLTAFAKCGEPLVIRFSEFEFITSDYNPDEVNVYYDNNNYEEIALIKDKTTGEIIERVIIDKVQTRAVGPYIFKREKNFGGTLVELSVHVELYTEGSFRQINSVTGKYLGITTQIAPTSIEDKTISVWSGTNQFPTSELFYAYSGTLVAVVETSVKGEVEAKLLKAGFSISGEMAGKTYYRQAIDSTGSIRVY